MHVMESYAYCSSNYANVMESHAYCSTTNTHGDTVDTVVCKSQ